MSKEGKEMTGYEWPEAARNDQAFGERVCLSKIEEERLKRTESTLAHLVSLHDGGMSNWWIRSNITFYATRYYQITGHYYTHTLQHTIVGGVK